VDTPTSRPRSRPRVAVVTESFLPHVNGVSNSVRHVVECLERRGHDVLVVAPGPGPDRHGRSPVVRVRSLPLPGYATFVVGLPDPVLAEAIGAFRPDVVHLASPFVLGAWGLRVARQRRIPTVAVYQTDVAGFARAYAVARHPLLRADLLAEAWVRSLHHRADRTLVPSRASHDQLRALDVPDLHVWRRGVSLDLFGPAHRSEDLRRALAPGGETLVGYVGRLAHEKQVHRLAELTDLPGVRLVVVGAGPARAELERAAPTACFLGLRQGPALARAFATLDVFVHPGTAETFCQTVQEAQASGVAVVAAGQGGPRDLVDHGRTGLLYPPQRPGALRDAVRRLVELPDLRRRLALAGHHAVQGRDWAPVVDELVDVHYAAVLGGPVLRAPDLITSPASTTPWAA